MEPHEKKSLTEHGICTKERNEVASTLAEAILAELMAA